jgi:hypothetical protein
MQKQPRDVVVVRVSEQGDREDENFHSPRAQLAKAKCWSEDQGNRVVAAFEEIDVSGKLPLARRPGLLRAIKMVEAGEADHIVVAYFDRLVRSLKVQLEVIERVERAGGEIYAIDHGRLTNGTAATRMSNNMYEPVLVDLGYKAVRADRDADALIITQMIQRLAIADLVVADITLANANVYYEIGIRHAAKKRGCVLVATEWARPVFDLDQMRQLRFPLTDGNLKAKKAVKAAVDALRKDLIGLVQGISPVFAAVPGFPNSDSGQVSAFEDTLAELSEFEADTRAVRAAPRDDRPARVRALIEKYGERPTTRDTVALELLRLVRDHLTWPDLLAYIDKLPEHVARVPFVREQHALARSGAGDIPGSIGELEQLISDHGETSERLGLLGGRYKRLADAAASPVEQRAYLEKAIGAYQRGMEVDLNDYYPGSNLPQLYRLRDRPGDRQLAHEAEVVTAVACRAAIVNGSATEWTRSTLLANAFDRGDVDEAVRMGAEVEAEGLPDWQLRTTIANLKASLTHHDDARVSASLQPVIDQLEQAL